MNHEWSTQFFNLRYLELFMTRSEERLKHESTVLKQLAHAQPGMSAVDFCCGTGDILDTLQKQGLTTHGVELCADYVRLANQRYPESRIVQGDALFHKFPLTFDIAYNWFSSFGYLGREDDRRLLANMVSHVKSGGRVLLETSNAYHVLMNFKAHMGYDKTWQGRPCRVDRSSKLDMMTRTMHQHWTIESDGDSGSYDTSFQLYFVDELVELMRDARLYNIEVYESTPQGCSVIGRKPSEFSQRLIIVGKKS
jgi:SAM-dependent methyltransferase